jgi:hypothetical protein
LDGESPRGKSNPVSPRGDYHFHPGGGQPFQKKELPTMYTVSFPQCVRVLSELGLRCDELDIADRVADHQLVAVRRMDGLLVITTASIETYVRRTNPGAARALARALEAGFPT